MLSCSWRWKIPGMGNRRNLDSREHHSTIKINQSRRLWLINKCRFANQGRKKKTQHVLPLPPFTHETAEYHWPLGRRPDGHPELSDLGS